MVGVRVPVGMHAQGRWGGGVCPGGLHARVAMAGVGGVSA